MKWLSKQIEIFRLAGIPIQVDYSWFIIFLIYTSVIARVYLPSMAPSMHGAIYWLLAVVTTLLFFISVLIHEMAHSLVARSEGIGIRNITLYIFGGLAHLEREPDRPLAEFKIAAAGPAASFSLAVLFYALAEGLFYGTTHLGPSKALLHLGTVNLLLACFNLLPGFPMDGGRILRALIWQRSKSYHQATRASLKAGAAIAFSLICVGLMTLLIQGDWLTGIWSVMTGLLLVQLLYRIGPDILRASRLEMASQPSGQSVRRVREVMNQAVAAVRPEMSVSEFLSEICAQRSYSTFPVVHDRRLHGILCIDDAKELPRERHTKTLVRELMKPVMSNHFVAWDLPIDEAVIRLTSNGFGHAAVLDNDGFVVGYLSLKDLERPR
ncbi:MAG: site-2 protease family protein [Acidobacteriota bacterium]